MFKRALGLISVLLLMAQSPASGVSSFAVPLVEAIPVAIDGSTRSARDGDVILVQQIRAIESVTVSGAIIGNVRIGTAEIPLHIPSGAQLYRMRLWTESTPGHLYCSPAPVASSVEPLLTPLGHPCLQDEDGNGTFDYVWFLSGDGALASGPIQRAETPLETHPTYAASARNDIPTSTIVISFRCGRYCAASDVQSPEARSLLLEVSQLVDGVKKVWTWSESRSWNVRTNEIGVLGVRLDVDSVIGGTMTYRLIHGLEDNELGGLPTPTPAPVTNDSPAPRSH